MQAELQQTASARTKKIGWSALQSAYILTIRMIIYYALITGILPEGFGIHIAAPADIQKCIELMGVVAVSGSLFTTVLIGLLVINLKAIVCPAKTAAEVKSELKAKLRSMGTGGYLAAAAFAFIMGMLGDMGAILALQNLLPHSLTMPSWSTLVLLVTAAKVLQCLYFGSDMIRQVRAYIEEN